MSDLKGTLLQTAETELTGAKEMEIASRRNIILMHGYIFVVLHCLSSYFHVFCFCVIQKMVITLVTG